MNSALGLLSAVTFPPVLLIWGKATLFINQEDIEWFEVIGGYLGELEKISEAGKFNPDQKVFFIALLFGWLIMVGTGIFLWFPVLGSFLTRWLYVFHVMGMQEGWGILEMG